MEEIQTIFNKKSSRLLIDSNLYDFVSVLGFDEKAEKNSVEFSATNTEISGPGKNMGSCERCLPCQILQIDRTMDNSIIFAKY